MASLPRLKIKRINVSFNYKWNWFAGIADLMRKRPALSRLPTTVHVSCPSLMGMFRPTRPEHKKQPEAKKYGGLWYCNRTVVCGKLCAAMRSNTAIMGQVNDIVSRLPASFTAVHWRMFQCRDYAERAALLVESLLAGGVPKGSSIYLLSGVTDTSALGILKSSFTVVTKLDFNPRIEESFPFSALALIDYEVAIRAARFYGIEMLESPSLVHLSTFSAFAVQMRSMNRSHNALLPSSTFC